MEAFTSRKRRRPSPPATDRGSAIYSPEGGNQDSTDLKLAILSSLYPHLSQDTIFECLVASEGAVEAASQCLAPPEDRASLSTSPRKRPATGYQSSLSSFAAPKASAALHASSKPITSRPLTRKGRTLQLYSPEDIAAHTPCSIIHNFLPAKEAEDLLKELLEESPTFEKQTFKLFDNVVQSPHSACFYVHSFDEQERQKTEYLYNGSYLTVGRIQSIVAQRHANLHLGHSPEHPSHAANLMESASSRQQRDRRACPHTLPEREETEISVTEGMGS